MTQSQRILIASDVLDETLRQTLTENRFETSWVADAEAALDKLATSACDLLIIDLADADVATSLLRHLRGKSVTSNLPILTIAEWGTGQTTLALSLGADAFERKPSDAASVLAAVEKLLRPRMAMTARASTSSELEDE